MYRGICGLEAPTLKRMCGIRHPTSRAVPSEALPSSHKRVEDVVYHVTLLGHFASPFFWRQQVGKCSLSVLKFARYSFPQ